MIKLRVHEWLYSKIPMLLGVVYAVLLCQKATLTWNIGGAMLALLLTSLGFAAMGYWVNDWFDRRQDAAAGKHNLFNDTSPTKSWSFVLLTLLAAVLPWVFLPHPDFILGLLALEVILYFLYALPPFRCKERGWTGVVIDSLYSSVIPAIILFITTTLVVHATLNLAFWVFAFGAMLLVSGLRKILIHQMDDIEPDRKAGVRTLVTGYGTEKISRILFRYLLPVEIVLTAVFIFSLSTVSLILTLILGTLFLLRLFFSPIGEGTIGYRTDGSSYLNRILNGMQEVDFPLSVLLLLSFFDYRYLILLTAHLLIFLPGYWMIIHWGRDYVAKPLYYQFIPYLYYQGYLTVRSWGIRFYHHVLLRAYYLFLVWPYYNIGKRTLVILWKAAFFIRHGKLHRSDKIK